MDVEEVFSKFCQVGDLEGEEEEDLVEEMALSQGGKLESESGDAGEEIEGEGPKADSKVKHNIAKYLKHLPLSPLLPYSTTPLYGTSGQWTGYFMGWIGSGGGD